MTQLNVPEKNCQSLVQKASESDLKFRWSQEQDRHKFELYVLRWALGSRHIIPPAIKPKLFDGIEVLDINCGPGLWDGHPILDMAQDFVHSSFYLVDTHSLLPQYASVDTTPGEQRLNNFTFIAHDTLQEKCLPFESDKFDFIQQRLMSFVYKQQDWLVILKELQRVTKPGGCIQLIEVEIPPQNLGPQGEQWLALVEKVMKEKRDIDVRVTSQLDQMLSAAGLLDIQTKFVSVPIGSWGLDIGNLWRQNYELFFESAQSILVELMGMSHSEYKRKVDAMMDELNEYKPFSNIRLVWGRVPGDS
ncbi:hypothetical protein G6F57_010436 [Rhizopus arrhizus]|uniref:Methyltransferase domain-containing protein n=1 Tax=Rhizopus oryzae TaxID=64495 RepID=A0A9P7BNL5_RHIOR|nr:hypothetical protein G6F23_006485 [Rhizopus arrhizus]KAG1412701.1 hypothetical protein G6F58_007885 [Rhizopus delemar]KAG0757677.1 hypothetical protein G6F24_010321 [Rhizopus arrhizus]KAG0776581.1 hypothetical protein G6F22_012471 [Rhizopus arrhizus]KAG0783774.1 hypothetical protein G6F21_010332 [Rhizopus arrhizus]